MGSARLNSPTARSRIQELGEQWVTLVLSASSYYSYSSSYSSSSSSYYYYYCYCYIFIIIVSLIFPVFVLLQAYRITASRRECQIYWLERERPECVDDAGN